MRFVEVIASIALVAGCSGTPSATPASSAIRSPASTSTPVEASPTPPSSPITAATSTPAAPSPTAPQSTPEQTAAVEHIDLGPGLVAPDGSIYFISCVRARVVKVDPSSGGVEAVVAGTGPGGLYNGFGGDGGPATGARLGCPGDLTLGPDNTLYFVDSLNRRVRRIDAEGVITTVAGGGTFSGYGGDGGPATEAGMVHPSWIAFDKDGRLYVSDRDDDRVRRVDTSGIITTFAGNGENGFSGDGGPATDASFDDPEGIAFDDSGNTYVVDDDNARIRRVDPDGIITTIAGTGELGYTGDGGPASEATFTLPNQLLRDVSGNFYVAEEDSSRIRVIAPNGDIDAFAGTGELGYTGDGGPATDATFRGASLAIDSGGRFYIFDLGNNCVRPIDAEGIISTLWCLPA